MSVSRDAERSAGCYSRFASRLTGLDLPVAFAYGRSTMNTIILTALSAAVLVPAAPPVPPAADQPTTGKVLVLTNERTVEGDVERIGERYRVCRAVGETWVDANQVMRLCASLEE